MKKILILIVFNLVIANFANAQEEIKKVRLPDAINAFQPAIVPIIDFDEKTLFFDRKFHFENTGNTSDLDEIWFSKNIGTNSWELPQKFEEKINTPLSDVLLYLSPDGKIALISGNYNNTTNSKNESGYSIITKLPNNNWSKPLALNIKNYTNDSSIYSATMSYDMKTMIISSAISGNSGGMDLYYSHYDESIKKWSELKSLGKTINTPYNEFSPFIAIDNRTLFFSSNRPNGLGGYDIYFAVRLDDTWDNWSSPQNLGKIINTNKDDNNLWLTSLGESAYIVSYDTMSKRQGIYKIDVPKQFRPTNYAFIRGSVFELTNNKKYLSNGNYDILCTNLKTKESRTFQIFPNDADYIIPVNSEGDYKIEITNGKYKNSYVIANVYNIKQPKVFSYDIVATINVNSPAINNSEIKKNNINSNSSKSDFFYEYNSDQLCSNDINTLVKIILNNQNETSKYQIYTYADQKGSYTYNKMLTNKRAENIRNILINYGVSESQINIFSQGETTKFGDEDNINRRLTLIIK